MQKITTFLMFEGQAEEAMNFYVSAFEQAEILTIAHHEDGSVMQAAFSIHGQIFMATDSEVEHDFAFTPAISLYVTCESDEEIERVYQKLKRGGAILMPLDSYPFSRKFGWVQDQFGVSWQLNLPAQIQ